MIDPTLIPPGLSWVLYAFAGDPVVIEIIDGQGQTFQVKADTVDEAWLYLLDVLGVERPAVDPDPRIERLKAESDERDTAAAAIAGALFEPLADPRLPPTYPQTMKKSARNVSPPPGDPFA